MVKRENHSKIILVLNLYKLLGKVKSFYFVNFDLWLVTLTNGFDYLILQANLKIGENKKAKRDK
jgi:hypothetical protein